MVTLIELSKGVKYSTIFKKLQKTQLNLSVFTGKKVWSYDFFSKIWVSPNMSFFWKKKAFFGRGSYIKFCALFIRNFHAMWTSEGRRTPLFFMSTPVSPSSKVFFWFWNFAQLENLLHMRSEGNPFEFDRLRKIGFLIQSWCSVMEEFAKLLYNFWNFHECYTICLCLSKERMTHDG